MWSKMKEIKCCRTETEKEDGNKTCAAADDKPTSLNGNLRRLSGPTRRSSRANWTVEEDEILSDVVQKYAGKCWKKIAECLPGRTDVQCLHRWQKVLDPALVKGPWSKQEDGRLVELVGKSGEKKWSEIAEQLPGRMGKQCRERWFNHLKPEINKAAWTDEEERILINAHARYGNKWCTLAKLLPGRTENSVKNHWNCSLKKRLSNYSACGSAVNHPRVSKKVVTREANQILSITSLCKQTVAGGSNAESSSMDLFLGYSGSPLSHPPFSTKPNNPVRPQKSVEVDQNPSTISSWRETVDSGSSLNTFLGYSANLTDFPSASVKARKSLRPLAEVQGCGSLYENDQRHRPPLVCAAAPDSPARTCSNRDRLRARRDGDVSDSLQSSSGEPYMGLCYEPIQRKDVDIYLSTGRFPSTERYIRQPRSIDVPPSRRQMKEACDSHSSTRSRLRNAAMSYRNMPSIIRKQAIQLLNKGVPAPENGATPLSRETAGHEVAKLDEDQLRSRIFLSQMSHGFKSLQPLKLWGFEQEFRDA